MEDSINIEVEMDGREYTVAVRLAAVGYTHKFYAIVNGLEVVYEPDEERNYRAVLHDANSAKVTDTDRALIQVVGDKLQSIREA